MARDFKGGLEIAVYARTVYVRRAVEREGVIQFPPALSRNASVHAATSSHFRHIEPSSGWVGRRRGVDRARSGLSADAVAMSAPCSAAQIPRTAVSLGYSFRP